MNVTMNISGDRISQSYSSYNIYECRYCKFTCNRQAIFIKHKQTKKCALYSGNWFLKTKKKGYKNYYHIVHSFYWNQVMDGITNIRK
jgi:hypothetical protein